MKNVNLTISRDLYKINPREIKNKISRDNWVDSIEKEYNYFIWFENTEKGEKTLNEIEAIPESFRDKTLKGLNKLKACAEYNEKKKYYELIVLFVEDFGLISITNMRSIDFRQLQSLLNLAKHLDAYLLNNGTEIIDESYLESLS
ncbi:hypothetical protein OOZ15_19440 [Galbibacter sp. EGI 63066]|uniref:hypothetical protein n=1 Tax=Galbibacter sp. EGI 63066 TaxID=2993559 RepID=UPI002249714E|nr:hypothetical protein [Galbibacter sp. EGI 63066]MCX2682129.1 hypothetical protein [Galbibacter sp. EGI 63066]